MPSLDILPGQKYGKKWPILGVKFNSAKAKEKLYQFCSLEKRRKERPHIKEMKCLDRAKMAILGYFAEATERQIDHFLGNEFSSDQRTYVSISRYWQ